MEEGWQLIDFELLGKIFFFFQRVNVSKLSKGNFFDLIITQYQEWACCRYHLDIYR